MKYKIPKGYRVARLGEKLISWYRMPYSEIDRIYNSSDLSGYLYYEGCYGRNTRELKGAFLILLKKNN